MDLTYITSERFIHDDLLQESVRALETYQEAWRQDSGLPAYAFAWPSETIRGDDGARISRVVVLEMPPHEDTQTVLRALMVRTKAYALLLIEQKEGAILALFESHHGTRSWKLPIQRHGDLLVLGDPEIADDQRSFNLLWSPQSGHA